MDADPAAEVDIAIAKAGFTGGRIVRYKGLREVPSFKIWIEEDEPIPDEVEIRNGAALIAYASKKDVIHHITSVEIITSPDSGLRWVVPVGPDEKEPD